MEIHTHPSGVEGVTLLALDGGLDHTTTALFVAKMDELLQQGTSRVVLDLRKLTYASSWGLAAMVRVHHHYAVRGGRIAFADLHAAVAKILPRLAAGHAVRPVSDGRGRRPQHRPAAGGFELEPINLESAELTGELPLCHCRIAAPPLNP